MAEKQKDIDYIVRIANKDLNGEKPVYMALTEIKGIGIRLGQIIARKLEKETGFKANEKIGKTKEKERKVLEDILENPEKHNIPNFYLNRRKDIETGKDLHLIMGDLDFSIRQDKQREGKTKSYRGLRHTWKLPVRGQKTKSTHRKGGAVGVIKKKK